MYLLFSDRKITRLFNYVNIYNHKIMYNFLVGNESHTYNDYLSGFFLLFTVHLTTKVMWLI